MVELMQTDLIWNRACGGKASNLLAGDLALAAMLVAHGLTMNGGVLHAVDCLKPEDLADAEAGYRYFGLGAAADLLREAKTISEAGGALDLLEAELDKRYRALIPSDSMLNERFEASLRWDPSGFAAL